MAKRMIGSATVRITYNDAGDYRGTVSVGGGLVWRFDGLMAPPIGHGVGVAYDSIKAYDRMAEAAVSFGASEHGWIGEATECAAGNPDGSLVVRRVR